MSKTAQVAKNNLRGKRQFARAGEFWTINDGKTRGHKSLITTRKDNDINHIPITHSPTTRKMKNIKLQENPDKHDKRDSYILPKTQKSTIKDLGKKQAGMKISNPTDKSVIRHIKKR